MTTFVFANNIDTTLASSISSSATTITLSSGTNLPTLAAGQTFVVTLNDAATQQIFEVMYATAISGTTLTVSRAQEGTTAQAWAAGDYVFSGPTAGQMRSFYQGQSVGQGSVTSVGMSMPSGFSVSGSPITVAGTLGVTFASQNAGLFLATPVTGGSAGAATWRAIAAADVNGALGYTAADAADVVNTFNGRLGEVTLSSTDVNGALGYTPADDAAVVHLANAETIAGAKTFSATPIFSGGTIQVGSSSGTYITFDYSGEFSAAISAPGVTSSKSIQSTAPWGGAGAAPNTMAINASGSYGGGIGMTDGSYGIGLYSDNGTLNFGLGSNTSITSKATLDTNGNFAANGALTCTTMNATGSDRRLKRDIKKVDPRPLHRAVPFVRYVLKDNGWHGLGSIAQVMKKAAPEHVGEFDCHGKTRLSLNYAGAAYEQAMWAGLALDKALDRIKVLEKRLAALERRV